MAHKTVQPGTLREKCNYVNQFAQLVVICCHHECMWPDERERAMIKRKGSAIHPANDSFIPHHAIQIRDGTGRAFRGVIKKGPTTSHPPQVHTIHPLKLLMMMVFWGGGVQLQWCGFVRYIVTCFSPHLVAVVDGSAAAPLICIIFAATSNERKRL